MTAVFRALASTLMLAALAVPAAAADEALDKAVEAVIDDWTGTLIAKDYDTWIGYWTDDGMLMPPGHPPVVGHAALLAYAKDDFAGAGTFSFSDWSIEAGGQLAVVTNDIEWGGEDYKQVIVLRNEDGAWKVHIVMFNRGVAGKP